MKNIFNTFVFVLSLTLFAASITFAQNKPAPKEKMAKHECTEECKTEGCGAKTEKMAKHKCTAECKENGCATAKAMMSDGTSEHSESHKQMMVVKHDKNQDGKVFACPMFCTDEVTDVQTKCSKCGMKTKEYSIKDVEKKLKKHTHKEHSHS